MSKYNAGPYHFAEFADVNSEYHAHVQDLLEQIGKVLCNLPARDGPLQIHEIGCGEGLLLHLLPWRVPGRFTFCTGNDADAKAVIMARQLVPNAKIEFDWNWPTSHADQAYDCVMLCDSLEHIANWQEHIEWAKKHAACVVIAIPSKHDRHALRQLEPQDIDPYFLIGWTCVHRSKRHSRHVSIWQRVEPK